MVLLSFLPHHSEKWCSSWPHRILFGTNVRSSQRLRPCFPLASFLPSNTGFYSPVCQLECNVERTPHYDVDVQVSHCLPPNPALRSQFHAKKTSKCDARARKYASDWVVGRGSVRIALSVGSSCPRHRSYCVGSKTLLRTGTIICYTGSCLIFVKLVKAAHNTTGRDRRPQCFPIVLNPCTNWLEYFMKNTCISRHATCLWRPFKSRSFFADPTRKPFVAKSCSLPHNMSAVMLQIPFPESLVCESRHLFLQGSTPSWPGRCVCCTP